MDAISKLNVGSNLNVLIKWTCFCKCACSTLNKDRNVIESKEPTVGKITCYLCQSIWIQLKLFQAFQYGSNVLVLTSSSYILEVV